MYVSGSRSAALQWCRQCVVDEEAGTVVLSKIFDWYGRDFGPDTAAVLRYAARWFGFAVLLASSGHPSRIVTVVMCGIRVRVIRWIEEHLPVSSAVRDPMRRVLSARGVSVTQTESSTPANAVVDTASFVSYAVYDWSTNLPK